MKTLLDSGNTRSYIFTPKERTLQTKINTSQRSKDRYTRKCVYEIGYRAALEANKSRFRCASWRTSRGGAHRRISRKIWPTHREAHAPKNDDSAIRIAFRIRRALVYDGASAAPACAKIPPRTFWRRYTSRETRPYTNFGRWRKSYYRPDGLPCERYLLRLAREEKVNMRNRFTAYAPPIQANNGGGTRIRFLPIY